MKIKKADEMEMSINFQAMRLSWVFVLIALICWCICHLIINGELLTIPFLIICMQSIIFFAGKICITRKMLGDNDEK